MLDKAYEAREEAMPYLKVERRFSPIRRDPRFAALLERLRLAQGIPAAGGSVSRSRPTAPSE